MCNVIINTFYVKSIDNDVTHRKIFTLSKLLVIFYTLKYGEFITYYLHIVDFVIVSYLSHLRIFVKYVTTFL